MRLLRTLVLGYGATFLVGIIIMACVCGNAGLLQERADAFHGKGIERAAAGDAAGAARSFTEAVAVVTVDLHAVDQSLVRSLAQVFQTRQEFGKERTLLESAFAGTTAIHYEDRFDLAKEPPKMRCGLVVHDAQENFARLQALRKAGVPLAFPKVIDLIANERKAYDSRAELAHLHYFSIIWASLAAILVFVGGIYALYIKPTRAANERLTDKIVSGYTNAIRAQHDRRAGNGSLPLLGAAQAREPSETRAA